MDTWASQASPLQFFSNVFTESSSSVHKAAVAGTQKENLKLLLHRGYNSIPYSQQ